MTDALQYEREYLAERRLIDRIEQNLDIEPATDDFLEEFSRLFR